MKPNFNFKTHSAGLFLLLTATVAVMALSGAMKRGIASGDFLESMETYTENFNQKFPRERVYVLMDKPLYRPGDDIWYGAWITDGRDLKASQVSDLLHVELINPKGNIEKSELLIAKDGKVRGDFALDENAAGGMYKLKAYTNWQKNDAETLIFEKEFQVQAVVLPNLKMKLDFERKAFGPGDDVQATLDLQSNENMPLADHAFHYVVSVNGTKISENDAKTAESGKAFVDFKLPAKLTSSDGILNVMIKYDGNGA